MPMVNALPRCQLGPIDLAALRDQLVLPASSGGGRARANERVLFVVVGQRRIARRPLIFSLDRRHCFCAEFEPDLRKLDASTSSTEQCWVLVKLCFYNAQYAIKVDVSVDDNLPSVRDVVADEVEHLPHMTRAIAHVIDLLEEVVE